MPRIMSFYNRQEGLDDETFRKEVFDVHVPMVVPLPGLKAYRQSLITGAALPDGVFGGNLLPFEGIAELWFDKAEEYQAALGTPKGQQAFAHAQEILDMAAFRSMVVEEHRIPLTGETPADAPNQPLRFMFFVTRRPDVTFDEFKRHIMEIHVPIVTGYPGLRRYTLAFNLVPEAQREENMLPFDAIAEHYYDSYEAYEAAFASPEAEQGIEDAKHFMSFDTLRMMVVKEYPITLGASTPG